MRFNSFRIRNYKGIKNLFISLKAENPRVVALTGLNESGKTTILEGISHFIAGDQGLQKVYGIDTTAAAKSSFVPKSQQLNFNSDISISANVTIDNDDLDIIEDQFKKLGYTITNRKDSFDIDITQKFFFENSNYIKSGRTWSSCLYVKKIRGSKIQEVDAKHECWKPYWSVTEKRLPQICYFPTFLFDIPDKIIIEQHPDETPVNAYYRRLVQDILDSLNANLSTKTHIIDRIRGKDGQRDWSSYLASDESSQVNHLLSSAASQITKVIMQSWKRVFKSSFEDKRIEIDLQQDPDTSLISLRLYLSDFPERYAIGERSLGFQWFFCFWLFTYFRTLRSDEFGVVFLIDEPAANLHAKAQEEILENLGKLASENNVVIYSTHSHYLINPAWIDKSLVVTNGTGNNGTVQSEFSDKKAISITATPYRKFSFKHKNQRNYFLPILDSLDYRPSELTLTKASLIVEGKADFAFFSITLPRNKNYSLIPAGGAMSMQPLISLLAGWGFPVACLLDADKEGNDAVKKYLASGLISESATKTLENFDRQFTGSSLEKIIMEDLGSEISQHFSSTIVDKSMVQTYLLEKLASGKKIPMKPRLIHLSEKVHEWAKQVLDEK